MAGATPGSAQRLNPRSSLQGFYKPWKINLLSPLCSSEMGKKKMVLAGKAEGAGCVLVRTAMGNRSPAHRGLRVQTRPERKAQRFEGTL